MLSKDKIILGGLSPIRDFTYVDDTARGFICAANNSDRIGEVINLGFGKGITIEDVAKLIMKLTGIEKDIYCEESRVRPKNSEVFHLISNNDKAKDLIGWEPEISLEDGLSETIEFVKKNIDLFKTNSYSI